ncbi:tripartite tricarboxylate transporter TctB family protein [Ramlibacter sp. AW1]|uniref:Tripartite tricarboxylate transporter TctB family protein n=1 Tax=Ramlibacter aurantiacus TaxID=2801330 RepID=A0A936ZVI3_9BURK|nr:tripartite tricarboxylate transporter TctB family protein [Ramlibacter aurantiacus]MBL0423371.1 tripartite tricarboxylate transporter TctB family protein [Ramlibacter aurantiacus]
MASRDYKDILGGVLLMLTGIVFALGAHNYNLGDAARMGPGYFPSVLGWILAVLGVLIVLPALRRPGERIVVQWKSAALVLAAVLYFAFSLPLLGLVLAAAGAVFISSLADHDLTWRGRFILSVAVPVLMVLIFITGLGMTLSPFPW